jgi:type II secretory pathway component PulL
MDDPLYAFRPLAFDLEQKRARWRRRRVALLVVGAMIAGWVLRWVVAGA